MGISDGRVKFVSFVSFAAEKRFGKKAGDTYYIIHFVNLFTKEALTR